MNKLFFMFLIIGTFLIGDNNITIPELIEPECERIYKDYMYFKKKAKEEPELKERWLAIVKKYEKSLEKCNVIVMKAPKETRQRKLDVMQRSYFAPNPLNKAN